jgi:hypothetical protein
MRPRQAVLLAVVAIAVVAQPVIAATAMTGPDAVNTDAESAHNPYIAGTVTVDAHEMGWDPMEYEANDGTIAELPAMVNESAPNPYTVTFSDIETSAYEAFPVNTRTEEDSALNAAGWATSAATGGSVSVSNVTTAPSVEAVQVSTSSQTAGDVVNASFDGFSIDSDAEKRYFSVVADVPTLDSAANVYIRAVDDDGDYVQAEIDADDNASNGNTMANSTGEGYVFQQRVGEMSVMGNGDGSMGAINETKVVVEEADATVDIAAINVEHTSPWTLGDQMVDSDDDGDKDETDTLIQVNSSGGVPLSSVDSMGSAFDAATIHSLDIEFHAYSSMMPEEEDYERWNVSYEEATDYPSFDWIADDHRRLAMPTAYDLSYSNLELRDEQPLPENRYGAVEYATTVGETNFSDISWTDATSSYNEKGSEVVLASGFSGGDEVAVQYSSVKLTQANYDAWTSTAGGGAPMGDSGGGLGSIPLIGGALVALLSFLGLRGGDGGA